MIGPALLVVALLAWVLIARIKAEHRTPVSPHARGELSGKAEED
jgi:hypothetical protein